MSRIFSETSTETPFHWRAMGRLIMRSSGLGMVRRNLFGANIGVPPGPTTDGASDSG